MASILFAASAAYVVIKWRIVLPEVIASVRIATLSSTRLDKSITRFASPVVVAVASGVVGGYAIFLQDDLLPYTNETIIAYALVVVAIITLMWADDTHWSIACLQLATILAIRLAFVDSSVWGVGVVLLLMLHAKITYTYVTG